MNLLRGHVEGLGPHVNLLEDVDARDDEEDARTSSSSCQEATKPEDHSSLVFLICFLFILKHIMFLT